MEPMTTAQRRIHQTALRLFAERGATQLSIRDLAKEAGVARGTIYQYVDTMDQLFEHVASQLSADMHRRIRKNISHLEDPGQRLANGIRFFIRRAHEEPQWGAFLSRFAMTTPMLRETLYSQATADVLSGLSKGRYRFRQEQLLSVISMIASSVLGAMLLVMEGHKTWREAGSDTAEMILRTLGIAPDEAVALATGELPPLPCPD
ncbi:TetR/AcrR family transcriptional regulator [Pseudomonas taiwanensis]|uniref:TetR/AcrR family transcriptional regulator n=1 Tax=Pseudomonas taiwanensis TaxID=470150 RepID=UPI0015BAB089|nr:TetR/AcrR family transcriptional regulator [Pseudomonas taiwanensis]NWL76591.1 TetR/AcrR family transcriptional regulator [Pseudomonas taiwanensis]